MPPAPSRRDPSSRFDGRIDAVVHAGFAVLMVASGVRYIMRHSPADNLWTVALAAAVCALYAVTAALARPRMPRRSHWVPWMVALVAAWATLVIVAPSFAWCSFAIFFLTRRAFVGWAGYAASGVTAAATAVGLFRMSGWTDVAMVLGPLAAGALLTLIYDKIERDQQQLAATEREAGIATERERVSREIHDTVTQGLASSLLLLEAAQRSWPDGSAQQDVAKASGLLRRNLAETRSLVHELSAPGLESGPLPEALQHAARQYVDTIQVQVTGHARPLPAEVRHALLRVTQSAAANIKLHAHADHASVTLGYLPEAVTLDVYDDGRGFDPGAVPSPSESGGYGLRAMRQRVEQLGGALSVESSPGDGTIIAAQLPLGPPADSSKEAL